MIGGVVPPTQDFGDAQAGEAVACFLHRNLAVAPAPPESLRHQIGQHDDDGMAAWAILGAQIDRPHFQVHRLLCYHGTCIELISVPCAAVVQDVLQSRRLSGTSVRRA